MTKFELLREAVGCYKANHVSGDTNEKALLEFIDELEQLTIPVVVKSLPEHLIYQKAHEFDEKEFEQWMYDNQ